jgi:PhoH-like ATPase
MNRKIFVLDTNVLLFDPQSPFKFGANQVIIPIMVIEEIDRFKKDLNENGRNARHFSRLLDDLRRKGNLLEGVEIQGGAILSVDMLEEESTIPKSLAAEKYDNMILAVALKHKKMDRKRDVIFVTKDTNLRIKADILGLKAVDYEPNQKRVEELFSGLRYIECPKESFDKFFSEKKLPMDGLVNIAGICPNEYIILRDMHDQTHTALGRHDATKNAIVPLLRGLS